jgi:hypothetical protein
MAVRLERASSDLRPVILRWDWKIFLLILRFHRSLTGTRLCTFQQCTYGPISLRRIDQFGSRAITPLNGRNTQTKRETTVRCDRKAHESND